MSADRRFITDEAVQAACKAMGYSGGHHVERWGPEVQTILTAALPHTLRAIADQFDRHLQGPARNPTLRLLRQWADEVEGR